MSSSRKLYDEGENNNYRYCLISTSLGIRRTNIVLDVVNQADQKYH